LTEERRYYSMSDRREDIPLSDDPGALMLSGDWDSLASADRLSLEGLGIGEEEFRMMRSVLLEATAGDDSAGAIDAPARLKGELMEQFDRAHPGGAPRGRVIILRRRRLMLAGVAASLAFLLIAAGVILISRQVDGDLPASPERLAQYSTEQDREDKDQSDLKKTDSEEVNARQTPVHDRRTPDSAAPRPTGRPSRKTDAKTPENAFAGDAGMPLIAKTEVTGSAMSTHGESVEVLAETRPPEEVISFTPLSPPTHVDAPVVAQSQVARTASVNDAHHTVDETQKSVSGVRTETPVVVHPKTPPSLNPSRPASQDVTLLRFLYACR